MVSALPIIKTVQATVDGLGRFHNVSGISEVVDRPRHGPIPDRAQPCVRVGGQLRGMVDEVCLAWRQPFAVGPTGKFAVVETPGYLYEAPALEPHAIPGLGIAKIDTSLVLGAGRQLGRGSEADGLLAYLRAEHRCAFYRRAACLPQRLVESAVEFLCPRRSQARESLQHRGYIHGCLLDVPAATRFRCAQAPKATDMSLVPASRRLAMNAWMLSGTCTTGARSPVRFSVITGLFFSRVSTASWADWSE